MRLSAERSRRDARTLSRRDGRFLQTFQPRQLSRLATFIQHPFPLRGGNSDLAQYSNTPLLHYSITPYSARSDSRTACRAAGLANARRRARERRALSAPTAHTGNTRF